ncbi:MAG TPA: alternative ribosome rescue aminoacyl-tRNA hydrolase ArfB [Haliangiales bacterium]|nr:alternative ribosome rescue aminoacyl-tRNA hydrolase ArfB [Haliangiales bacterium]
MRHLDIRPGVRIPASDLVVRAVRSSGPGGQNVNKVSSKVELRFDLPGTGALAPDVKARLRALARGRVDADGWLVVVSQATRDRPHNLQDARDKLADLVARALVPPRPRRPTRPTAASRERRLDDKQRRGRRKAERRRVD